LSLSPPKLDFFPQQQQRAGAKTAAKANRERESKGRGGMRYNRVGAIGSQY